MLTPLFLLDIKVLCGHCGNFLCTIKSKPEYEKHNDKCIFCHKRLLFKLCSPCHVTQTRR